MVALELVRRGEAGEEYRAGGGEVLDVCVFDCAEVVRLEGGEVAEVEGELEVRGYVGEVDGGWGWREDGGESEGGYVVFGYGCESLGEECAEFGTLGGCEVVGGSFVRHGSRLSWLNGGKTRGG